MGKKYKAALAKVDRDRHYGLEEACKLLMEIAPAKFDESVELAARLGVNPKHADQMIRSSVSLPHGTGKTVRVTVFAKGDRANQAREAGADFVGSDDLLEKIQGGWLDFDVTVATPDMMGLVGRLGRVLGPRGLMPNPKTGTVTQDVASAVADVKGGKISFRVDKFGIIHSSIGRVSFTPEKLAENAGELITALLRMKPSSAKGTYMKSVTVASTMSPGIRVDAKALVK